MGKNKNKNHNQNQKQKNKNVKTNSSVPVPVSVVAPAINPAIAKLPFVSVCTPTFNRRPFIPIMIQCFQHQTYPKERIEWIIVDDGTDKIEELVNHIPQVKYLKYDKKMTLGSKRNAMNDAAKGDIIVYMDDDDYYPPERISHAVERLTQTPNALCAGSSAMFIFFKHINKMYQFGPYGPNHATAATFAFKKELLRITRFNESSAVAEEKQFLKDYTIPFVQLDPKKSILVFSHEHNSFDKKELLKQMPNPTINDTPIIPTDLVFEKDILQFFMHDIDDLLKNYDFGKVEHKKDVTKQLEEIKIKREQMMRDQQNQQQNVQNVLNQQHQQINQLQLENTHLKNQVIYLENKMRELIQEKIQEKQREKQKEELNNIIL